MYSNFLFLVSPATLLFDIFAVAAPNFASEDLQLNQVASCIRLQQDAK